MVTEASDIASLAKKENQMVMGAAVTVIGRLVKEIWGDKVKRVRRGGRKSRKHMYLNLGRRTIHCDPNNSTPTNSIQSKELKSLQLPPGWTFMENTPDCVSFVKIEHWEFREACGSVEVFCKIIKREDKVSELQWTCVRTHGCECKADLPLVNGLGLREQIILTLEYIDRSSLCPGFSVKEGELIHSVATTVCGTYRKFATDAVEIRAYSQHCRLFSRPGSRCAACSSMVDLHNMKKARKSSSSAIHPFCNHRYLSKEEVEEKLKAQQQRRKMNKKRKKCWRSKFKSENLEIEEQANQDMCSVLDSCIKEKKDVPEVTSLVGATEKEK